MARPCSVAAVAAACLSVAAAQPVDCSFNASYPRQYVAYKTDKYLVIDGKLDDPAWVEVGWTEAFVDISTTTLPKFTTRAKIRWDDNYLYVGAYLQDTAAWANISSTCHCFNNSQDQVIFHDNDFEIFTDADGSTHYYKEYEMNVMNATWDLCLNKPYDDGGYENSTRVFGPAGWDMFYASPYPMRSAAWADGEVNNPAAPHGHWTVEVALPLQSLAYNKTAVVNVPPKAGDQWRINFSRVEWGVQVVNGQYQKYPSCQSCPVPGTNAEDNWVWSPQGSIAMHLPERWGFLQFSNAPVNSTAPVRNSEWTVREVAMSLYYAQHAYAAANPGVGYASNVTALLPYAATGAWALNGTCTRQPKIALSADGSSFVASIPSLDGSQVASITDDRFLTVVHTSALAALPSSA